MVLTLQWKLLFFNPPYSVSPKTNYEMRSIIKITGIIFILMTTQCTRWHILTRYYQDWLEIALYARLGIKDVIRIDLYCDILWMLSNVLCLMNIQLPSMYKEWPDFCACLQRMSGLLYMHIWKVTYIKQRPLWAYNYS